MPTPPVAPKRPHEITRHNDTRVDPYYWLMERSDEVLAHLEAENAYRDECIAPLKPFEDAIYEERKNRIEETDISVPNRIGAWWYFSRTKENLNYPISCRLRATPGDETPPVVDAHNTLPGEEVIFDANVEAGDADFFSLGVLALSPDDRWLAVATDFEGNERHELTIRPIAGQEGVDDVIENVYYGFAWANDNEHFFYVRSDEAMRPWQVWRHQLGTSASDDVLVFQEDDAQFNVSVGRTRNDQMIMLHIGSSKTTEVHYLRADSPTDAFTLIEPRTFGIEYDVDHHTDANGQEWWLKSTNEEAKDFRLLVRPVHGASAWREVIPARHDVRFEGLEAFTNFFAIAERSNGCLAVRIAPALKGEDPFGDDLLERSYPVQGSAWPDTVAMSANANVDTTMLRVITTSLITPRLVADVVVETGEMIIRRQQEVRGGYDESQYVTGRLLVPAADGVLVPVSVAAHRDFVRQDADGTLYPVAPAPVYLYGYGSYESCNDPFFSSGLLSFLDRGVIYALAHVRGGGEMGREWYEMGRLNQKATTFSDFVSVAQYLVDNAWTTSKTLVARGGSAGGLLIGAAINLAPELFGAVVAEVPFVDVVTTMLDASLPLTVGEWEEWGNPDASDVSYRIMKGYSPYDNIQSHYADGSALRYPNVYATGGLNDSRVGFWEPAKWVQKLRDANPENQVILKTEMGAGHMGPSGRYDAWRDEAQVTAWMLNEMGLTH